jgi:hypothetical protein
MRNMNATVDTLVFPTRTEVLPDVLGATFAI